MSRRLVMHVPLLVCATVMMLGQAGASTGADPAAGLAAALAACRTIADDDARLGCYDALPLPRAVGHEFRGKGSGVTDSFEVVIPLEMRFDSDDAVMVLYLLDDQGQVVQNLHHGGAGGGRHLIETPGRYHVQVNATGGWTIRLSLP